MSPTFVISLDFTQCFVMYHICYWCNVCICSSPNNTTTDDNLCPPHGGKFLSIRVPSLFICHHVALNECPGQIDKELILNRVCVNCQSGQDCRCVAAAVFRFYITCTPTVCVCVGHGLVGVDMWPVDIMLENELYVLPRNIKFYGD